MASSDDEERIYAVRFALAAAGELSEEHSRLVSISGSNIADSWRSGLLNAVRTLATLPKRCIVAPEDEHFGKYTIYQLLYRRNRGPSWRVLFTVHEADENDPPTVQVHHIRHGAQGPMTEWTDEDE